MFGFLLCTLLAVAAAQTYDVAIYGGTPAGITAAIAAAGHGARVVLLEQQRHVGGLTTSGLNTAEFRHIRVDLFSGLCLDFYRRLGREYGARGPVWEHESHTAQHVFDRMLEEARVPVQYARLILNAEKKGRRITRLRFEDGSHVEAQVFIDASYEGDLMARAGVSWTMGREGRDQYAEPLAGIRFVDQTIPVSPYDENGALLPNFTLPGGLTPGAGDKRFQNYNFRLCVTARPGNRVPIAKPLNYRPERFKLLARYLAARPETRLRDLISFMARPNGKYELNNRQDAIISLGHFGANFDYPEASHRRRAEIWLDHQEYSQGLLYFLGHDPRVPEPIRVEMLRYGLCKDEFPDNNHWPYYLYIREARRMIGAYVMTQRDRLDDRRKPDSIALGSHYIDSHHVQRVAVSRTGFVNEGRLWVETIEPFEISYRSMTPKQNEAENLLVPVCLSASRVAFCAIRLEPTWMMLGESAGVAAALAARERIAVQQVNAARLQKLLRESGLLVDLP